MARNPTDDEMMLGLSFVTGAKAEVWDEYAQVVLLNNEFAFVD